MEAPRGSLCRYVVIKDGLIDNYRAVVPNLERRRPRDANTGQPGAYEVPHRWTATGCATRSSRWKSSARCTTSTLAFACGARGSIHGARTTDDRVR